MKVARLTCQAAVLGLLLMPAWSSAGTGANSAALVRQYVQQQYGANPNTFSVTAVADGYVAQTFPGLEFFGLQFRQYPIAFLVPEGLSASNVAIVFDGDVYILTSSDDLGNLFTYLGQLAAGEQFLDAVRTYLRLTQEFVQDMFYTFGKPNVDIFTDEDGIIYPYGWVEVTGGGGGYIVAALAFDPDGFFLAWYEDVQVVEGPRPICQATKLLDPDPIVRKMAEQALRDMGRPAKQYLDEQRAKARPELKEAIDRVWKQIEERERKLRRS